MNDFITRLKNDSKFLLTLMLVLAAILMLFFFFWAGLVVFFFVAVFIWAAFIFAYLRILFQQSFVFRIVVFFILFSLTFWLFYKAVPEKFGGTKSASSTKARKLVDCTSTASASTLKVDGWNTYLFPAEWTGEYTPYPRDKSAQKETYSLSNIGTKGVANIFYQIEKTDGSYLPKETERIIEVCDANNKTYQYWTTGTTKRTGVTGDDVLASVSYINKYNINEKLVPGDFRVDAYLYINGKWTLTDRVNNVRIEK